MAAKNTASPAKRRDPLTTFCFRVALKVPGVSVAEGFFKSVGGLKSDAEVVDYAEGGANHTTSRLVGRSKWPNLVLKRGFCGPAFAELMAWRWEWLGGVAVSQKPLERAKGSIVQLDSYLQPVCSWAFERAWPCKWEGPDYDADKQELAVEILELAHEGLVFIPK